MFINFRKSLYKVINFRGVMHVHVPSIWSLKIEGSIFYLAFS
jgi:hypothetical protein